MAQKAAIEKVKIHVALQYVETDSSKHGNQNLYNLIFYRSSRYHVIAIFITKDIVDQQNLFNLS